MSQQIGLLPDNSLAQLLKSISAEQGQRNPKRRKKTPHHDYVVSKLDTVCESDFNAQLFLQPCLPSSQKGPPLNSNPNTPDTSAVSLEVGSLEAVQQVTHQALVFQLPNTTSRGPPLHTTSISAIYRTLNGSEKTANTVQFFYSVVLYRIESLVTQAYRFKKPFPELTDYFVDVIAAGRIESESEKARKVIRKGFKRYVRLGAKVDSILAHGGEGWLFGLSTAYTASK